MNDAAYQNHRDGIAPAFVYFASKVDSPYVTGEVLTLLGGGTRAG